MRNKRIWNPEKQSFDDLLDFGINDGTGLLDSTGREMFTGDIVRCRENYNSDEYVSVINYIERLGCYGLTSPANQAFCHTFYGNLICNEKLCPSLTVIGNIYQNQNILEDFAKLAEAKQQQEARDRAEIFSRLQRPYKVKKISQDKYSFFYEDKKYTTSEYVYQDFKYLNIYSKEIDDTLGAVRSILGINFRSSSIASGFIFSRVGWSPQCGYGNYKDPNNKNIELVINKIKEGL